MSTKPLLTSGSLFTPEVLSTEEQGWECLSTYLAMWADSWHENGAHAVSIVSRQHAVFVSPSNFPWRNVPPSLRAPIRHAENILGEMRLYGVPPTQAHRQRLAAEAHLVAQVLTQHQELDVLSAQLSTYQDQLMALYELAESVRQASDLRHMAHAIAVVAQRLFRVQSVGMLVEVPNGHFVHWHPTPLFDDETLHQYLQRVSQRQEILTESKATGHIVPANVQTLMAIPIGIEGEVQAVLVLCNRPSAFSTPDVKLAMTIAEQVGAYFENEILHQEKLKRIRLLTEMELAKRVQAQLLPQTTPHFETLDIFAKSVPSLHVGGDFYDFVPKGDGWMIFTVGDVSGKGMSAALLMAVVRTVLRTKAKFLPTPTPENILARANEDLYEDFTNVSMFATAFVGSYREDSRTFLLASAGHAPIIYMPAGEGPRLVEPDGTALGVLPESFHVDRKVSLLPGDVFVVATDGFHEATNTRGEMFGLKRIFDILTSVGHRSAAEIGNALYQAVQEFTAGTPMLDDQTLLVLKGV